MSKIVDVSTNFRPHTQLGLYDYLGIPRETAKGIEPVEYIKEMDEAGVAMVGLIANVVANGVGGEELACHVDEVAPVLEQYPDRFFGWVGINPTKGMETLRYIEYGIGELGFKGVHVYPHWFGLPVNDRTYWPIYAKCCELGVPITLQVGSNSMRSGAKLVAQPQLLDDVAFAFPELKLVGLHIGRPWAFEMTMLAQNYENVFIIADAYPPRSWEPVLLDYINQVQWANRDGSDKVMWGTDWPVQTVAQSLSEIDALGLADDVKGKLIGGNAGRILGLDL